MKQLVSFRQKQALIQLKWLWPMLLIIVAVAAPLMMMQTAKAAVGYQSSATAENGAGSNSLSIAMPSGTVANDVMIAVISVRGGTGVTMGQLPSGWVAIPNGGATSGTALLSITYYKIATSGEAGPYVFMFTSGKAAGVIARYSGVDIASPINTAASQTGTTTPTAPSITTTVANTMLVAAYSVATGGTLTPGSSMTVAGQATSSGGGSAGTKIISAMQYGLQAGTGASGTKTMSGASTTNIGHLIALQPAPIVSQVNYRFFQNTDSTTASTPYALAGAVASIPDGTPFRLRLNLGVASGSPTLTNIAAHTYTLQYALRGSDNTCDTSFTGETYTDVTGSSTIRSYNNATPANGAAYVTSANDPTRSGITAIPQKYQEQNPLAVGTNVPANQDALWDIVLMTNGVTVGQSYCLRAIDAATSQPLNGGYTAMPEFTIPSSTLTQANYRWFANADSITPGAPLALQDSPTSVTVATPFRLRQRISVDTAPLSPSSRTFKMQYAEKVGTCDVGFSGEVYSDINATGGSPGLSTPTFAVNDGSQWTPWTNVNGALTASDASVAQIVSPGSSGTTISQYLNLTNFPFAIPGNATITGIKVTLNVSTDAVGGGLAGRIDLRMLKSGSAAGTGKGNFSWTTSTTTDVSGGSSDLWGTTWVPADINSSNFGISFAASAAYDGLGATTTMAAIDGATVEVYYTVPGLALQYFGNASPADMTTISSSGNDPINGARSPVYQSYREIDPFTNNVGSIAAGNDGMWDFALTSSATAAGKTYCLRTVKTDGSLLDSYSQIPELSVAAVSSGPMLNQQLRGGQSVISGVKSPFIW